ncbi:MAG: hypothetical protein QME57_03765 [Patescibacteria group bacterium]|nr:hypothetical protein [Patescibacteria group bacterium]
MNGGKGTLLEHNIKLLFEAIGFNAQTRKIIRNNGHNYEIDVYAEDKEENIRIIVQCKQYESSPLQTRDWIHQWNDKYRHLKKPFRLNKFVLAIWGGSVSTEHKKLANGLGHAIWDESQIARYQKLANEKKVGLRDIILKELNIERKQKPDSRQLGRQFVIPKVKLSDIIAQLEIKGFSATIETEDKYLFPFYVADLKVDCNRPSDKFKYKKDFGRFFCALSEETIQCREDQDDTFVSVKISENYPEGWQELQTVIDINKVEEEIRKRGSDKKIFYFSNLQDEFDDLDGVYKEDRKELVKLILKCYREDIEYENQKVNKRYRTEIEKLDDKIQLLQHDNQTSKETIKHLKSQIPRASNQRSINALYRRISEEELKIQSRESKIELFEEKSSDLSERMESELADIENKYRDRAENSVSVYKFTPKKDEIVIYDSNVYFIPQVVSQVKVENPNSSTTTQIIIEYDGHYSLGKCSLCNETINDLNSIFFCSKCMAILCRSHRILCNTCQQVFCKDDVWVCPVCHKPFCHDEKKISCAKCSSIVDPHCAVKCSDCGKIFCYNDIKQCKVCKNYYCGEHITTCRICGENVCNHCLEQCKLCGNKACINDFLECDICHNTYCKKCLVGREKLLSSEKDIRCKKCFEEKPPLGVKIKRIFSKS